MPLSEAIAAAQGAIKRYEGAAAFGWRQGGPISRIRNAMAASCWEKTNADALLFVDDDVLVPPDAIQRMVELKKPVVSLPVPFIMKSHVVCNCAPFGDERPDEPPPPWMLEVFTEAELEGAWASWVTWDTWDRTAGPFRIKHTGFGCVMVRKDVFERIPYPWFRYIEARPDGVWGMTEDVYFAMMCLRHGVEMWTIPDLTCGHLKRVNLAEYEPTSPDASETKAKVMRALDSGRREEVYEEGQKQEAGEKVGAGCECGAEGG
jgi:hypothetical protein